MPEPEPNAPSFDDQLQALVGQPVGTGGPSIAPDLVNQPMIRHWAAAFEDTNPVYTDESAARSSRFGEIVAPPLMLQTWTMATPTITGIRERGGSPVEGGGAEVLRLLDGAGFVGTLATNSEFEIVRYLRIGERISATTVVDSISAEKRTRLGPGRFLTWVTTYLDDASEVVGGQLFRILKFKPEGQEGNVSDAVGSGRSGDSGGAGPDRPGPQGQEGNVSDAVRSGRSGDSGGAGPDRPGPQGQEGK